MKVHHGMSGYAGSRNDSLTFQLLVLSWGYACQPRRYLFHDCGGTGIAEVATRAVLIVLNNVAALYNSSRASDMWHETVHLTNFYSNGRYSFLSQHFACCLSAVRASCCFACVKEL